MRPHRCLAQAGVSRTPDNCARAGEENLDDAFVKSRLKKDCNMQPYTRSDKELVRLVREAPLAIALLMSC